VFQPLKGLRVLDLSVLIPGAACTRYFSDYGADVVKVEQPPAGDWLRQVPPVKDRLSLLHVSLDRNKRSVGLSLKEPEGRAVFHHLVRTADAIVEVSRPGALASLGADYDTVAKINPRIVYLSLTGFGQDSAYAELPTHGANLSAFASVMSAAETAGALKQASPPFGRYRIPLEESALHGAFALLSALRERDKTGQGRHIDVPIVHTLLIGDQVALIDKMNRDKMFWVDWQQPAAKNAFYRASDGRVLGVAPLEKRFWERFCQTIGRPDLLEDSGSTAVVDLEGAPQELYAQVQQTIGTRPREEWLRLFVAARIPAAPLNTPEEALDDPDLGGRLITTIPHPLTGEDLKMLAPAVQDPPRSFAAAPPPAFAEHTAEVLADYGVPDALIQAATASGQLVFGAATPAGSEGSA
jgi:crotonobetainyl-CoA:carnitine CoA-transferase CaiB-like acyl-CoA transferase